MSRPATAIQLSTEEKAIELIRPHAAEITLRGDTDFTLSGELDRWDSQGIRFIFGMDAHPKVVQLAESLSERPGNRLSGWLVMKSRPSRVASLSGSRRRLCVQRLFE